MLTSNTSQRKFCHEVADIQIQLEMYCKVVTQDLNDLRHEVYLYDKEVRLSLLSASFCCVSLRFRLFFCLSLKSLSLHLSLRPFISSFVSHSLLFCLFVHFSFPPFVSPFPCVSHRLQSLIKRNNLIWLPYFKSSFSH